MGSFTILKDSPRDSAVKPLSYGWNQIPGQAGNAPPSGGQPAFPAQPANPFGPSFPTQPNPAPPAAAPAYPAPAPAAAAPPAPAAPAPAEPVDDPLEDEPMSKAWAAKVTYDRSQDVFPEFPPGYRTFDEIWADFQAKKARGEIREY